MFTQFPLVSLFACTCTHSGVWCESPALGPGQVVGVGVSGPAPHRSRLELACRPGHAQKGELTISCQANGKWSRPEGACHRKYMF